MRTLSIALALAVTATMCSLPGYAADNAYPGRASSDGRSIQQADGVRRIAPPAARPSEDEATCGEADDCCAERAPDDCLSCLRCNACPCLYADVEALFLNQVPHYQNRPVIVDATSGETLQSTSDLNSGFDLGLQATIGVRFCNGLAVEFGYLGFNQEGVALAAKPNASSYLIFPNNYAGNVFVNMDRVQSDYSSYLNSFELNFPCCCGCCKTCGGDPCCGGGSTCGECGCAKPNCGEVWCSSIEWFAGVRYLDLGSYLNFAVGRQEFGGTEQGSYNVLVSNHLIGGQIGGRLRRTINRFGWELTGKAGVYGNDAEQTQSVIDYPNFPLRPQTTTHGNNTAFVGEINFSGLIRLTDVWTLKAGYNVIWIESIALAPDQLDFNFATSPSGNQLNSNGGLLLHGANVGIEARW